MGIYDREYYRGETAGSGLVQRRLAGLQGHHRDQRRRLPAPEPPDQLDASNGLHRQCLAASPEDTLPPLPPLAAADGDVPPRRHLWHLLGNMWFLWIVGREMESLYGSRDFLAFYLAAAVFSTLGLGLDRSPRRPGSSSMPMIGASGAVMAVVTLFTLFYPKREILFFFIPMPMWLLLAIYLFCPAAGRSSAAARRGSTWSRRTWPERRSRIVFKQFDLRWSRLILGRGLPAAAPDLLAGRLRAGPAADAEPVADLDQRRRRRQVALGLRPARRAARRAARRGPRQDRPRRRGPA